MEDLLTKISWHDCNEEKESVLKRVTVVEDLTGLDILESRGLSTIRYYNAYYILGEMAVVLTELLGRHYHAMVCPIKPSELFPGYFEAMEYYQMEIYMGSDDYLYNNSHLLTVEELIEEVFKREYRSRNGAHPCEHDRELLNPLAL